LRAELKVWVRRFWCDAVLCGRRIFAERFGDDVLAPMSRRTGRMEIIVHHLGLALGGRPAANFAERLMVPISNDTLLRVVRRKAQVPSETLTVIGIDDFAWRRNHRYGTIVCDLERRRTVTLLPDREPATSEAWLRHHPSVTIIARDRGGGYGEAAAKALPAAEQVADRWHLMENASRAFLDAVRKSMRQIRSVIGATVINPALLTCAERLQYDGYQRREEANAAVMTLFEAGVPIKQIVRRTGLARDTVRRIVRGQRSDVFRTRQSSLEELLPWLDAQWDAGNRNAAALWRAMRVRGFRGSLRVVSEWATRRRRAEKVDAGTLTRIPSARTIARFMTNGRDKLSKAETVLIAAIESGLPQLVKAREIIADFHQMIRTKAVSGMTAWIERASDSLVASFCSGVRKDEAAVRSAITSPWSNGQTEGQITKLKLVKRQMYGRGKIDLLQARLIGAI
jgi:transposase